MQLKYQCSHCKSTNVEILTWVNPNDLRKGYTEEELGFIDISFCYCNNCQKNYTIDVIEVQTSLTKKQ